jgi:hypothetical protein
MSRTFASRFVFFSLSDRAAACANRDRGEERQLQSNRLQLALSHNERQEGLEARAFRALPLLCAKRLRLLQLIYIPNNVMATQREGHFLWISFLAIDVTSHLEREVGRGVRRNRRALDTARTLAELRAGHEQMAASSRECRPHGLDT